MKILAIVVLSVAGLSGCANLGSMPTAGLCAEMFKFANATPLDEKEKVKFRTSWGSGFNSDEGAFFEYECAHYDYTPGRILCDEILKVASIEFMGINIQRTLDCINGGAAWEGGSNLIVEELDGKVKVSGRRGLDKGVTIEIEFSTKSEDQEPFLIIAASRRKD